MKKIITTLSIFAIAAFFTGAAYSITNIESAKILRKKIATCSPYIHNNSDSDVIVQVVGNYNRACVVRAFTLQQRIDCNIKKADLKNFKDTVFPLENFTKAAITFDDESSDNSKTENPIASSVQDFVTSGVCTIKGDSSES